MNVSVLNFLTRKGHLTLLTTYSPSRETNIAFLLPDGFSRDFIDHIAAGHSGHDKGLIDFMIESEHFPVAEAALPGVAIELLERKISKSQITPDEVIDGEVANHVMSNYAIAQRILEQMVTDNIAVGIGAVLENTHFTLVDEVI